MTVPYEQLRDKVAAVLDECAARPPDVLRLGSDLHDAALARTVFEAVVAARPPRVPPEEG